MAQKKRISEDNISYSVAINEIEEIVAQLSDGTIDIDTLPAKVKRGAELISLCRNRLRETEESVAKILDE